MWYGHLARHRQDACATSKTSERSTLYQGQTFDICVADRPDIIAIKDDWAVVEDIKTGKLKHSHQMQMLLYLSMLPFAPETNHFFKRHIPQGCLVYRDRV